MIRIKHEKKRPKKVVNKDIKNKNAEASKKSQSAQKKSASKGFYYSFFTIILFLCLTQVTISAVLNVSKVISHKAKILQMENARDDALTKNEQLKESIKNYSNIAGSEAIARNNLKMSSPDEVLVIIHSQKDENAEEKNLLNSANKNSSNNKKRQ